jgi:hypothetical protein
VNGRDRLGIALGALWAAGHIAGLTLLGITFHEDAGSHSSAAAMPDMPLTEPDPLPAGDA